MKPTLATRPDAALAQAPLPQAGWPVAGALGAFQAARAVVVLPFDAVRTTHARAARAGLVPRSMLASRDFEQGLGALERLLLGPWARRV